VLFPVAGDAGLGTASVAMTSGKAAVIWVNNDGYLSEPAYQSVMLTTVYKQIADPVGRLVTEAASGGSDTSDYLGTLANGGVGLSPFHDFESQVPDSLKAELAQIGNDIQSGAIAIKSAAQPAKS
jgi:basic membrane protein A